MIAAMISVVIPTLNAEAGLARCLTALVPAAVDGVVREVIIADGGSTDATAAIADDAGATFLQAARGRGQQLAAGAGVAKSGWLLFLHADTVLEPGWEDDVLRHLRATGPGGRPGAAAVFRFRLDDRGVRAAWLQTMVALRCAVFALPYGDQGLLISRRLYDEIGGFRPLPLMEDVDIVRRLGRRRIVNLRSAAVTSARRYRKEGYFRRSIRNLACLGLYFLRVPPRYLTRLYG
jgi:rSAM/selenodomain-associated transferase 2